MRCSLIARCSSLLRLWRLPNLKSVVRCCLVTPCLVAGILVGLVGAQERSLQLPPRLPGGSPGSSPGPDRGAEQRGLPPASALNPAGNPAGTPNSDSRSLPALPTAQPMRGAAGVATGSVGAVPSGSQTAGLAGSSQGNAADGVALEPSTYRSRISIQGSVVRLDVCLVKVIEKIELPAREAGVLRALAVRDGNLVDANSLLAKVDDHQAVTELESAKRRLEASQLKISSDIGIRYAQAAKETAWKAFRREDTLVRRNAGTEAKRDELQLAAIQADLQYEKAQHDFNVDQKAVKLDELQVQKAQQLLDRHDIFSPWAGVVTQVLKRQGEWVNAGDPILELVQMERLWIEGDIDPRQLNPHQISGRPVQVNLQLAGGQTATFTGYIAYLDTQVVGDSFKIRAEVQNRQQEGHWLLIPGMYVDMSIDLAGPTVAERVSQQQ